MISSRGFSVFPRVVGFRHTQRWYMVVRVPGSLTFHHFSIRIQCAFASPSPPAKASVPPPAFDHHNVVVLRSRRRGRSVQTRPPRHPSFHLKNVETWEENIWKDWKNWKCHQNPIWKATEIIKSNRIFTFLRLSSLKDTQPRHWNDHRLQPSRNIGPPLEMLACFLLECQGALETHGLAQILSRSPVVYIHMKKKGTIQVNQKISKHLKTTKSGQNRWTTRIIYGR